MKNVLKQLGKSLCYVVLFLGMQFIVNFIFQFLYGFKLGLEIAASGTTFDEQAMTDNLMEFIMSNANWITLISGILTLLSLLLFFKIRKKKLYQEVQLCKFDRKLILPLVGVGISLSFLISCLLSLLPIPESIMNNYLESAATIETGGIFLRILTVVIIAPVVEEIVFRGLVLTRLRKAMGSCLAIIISSLLFAIMHGQILWIAYTFVFGIVLAIVAERTKSTGCTILLHISFNFMGLFGEYMMFSITQVIIVGLISLVVLLCLGYYIMMPKRCD